MIPGSLGCCIGGGERNSEFVSSSIWRKKLSSDLPVMGLSVPEQSRSSLEEVGSAIQPGLKGRMRALGDLCLLEAELC